MGKNQSKRLRHIEGILGLEANTLKTHSWRRSGASALADTGISLINLKKAGRWKSSKVAEGYIENSKSRKIDQMKRLDSGKVGYETEMKVSKMYKNALYLKNHDNINDNNDAQTTILTFIGSTGEGESK